MKPTSKYCTCPMCKAKGVVLTWEHSECQYCGFFDQEQIEEFGKTDAVPEDKHDIRNLQAEIKQWADSVLPNRTWFQAVSKLVMEEIPELLQNPEDPLEYADLFIILIDLADMKGIDLQDAVRTKLQINRDRQWGVDSTTGFLKHTSPTFSKDEMNRIEAEGIADDEMAEGVKYNG